ncbi:MAG: hypothetical protein ACK2UW_11595 [Anaerolineales bacterium]
MLARDIIRALGPIDLHNIRRDSLLRGLVLFPFGLAFVVRYLLPPLADLILSRLGFDLQPYYPLLIGLIAMFVPLMYGVVVGFMLLDQRDDHTLTALRVTPLSLKGYLLYRLGMPTVLAFVFTLFVLVVNGLVALNGVQILGMALGSAPMVALGALFLAGFAANKIQGFALQKISGVFLMPPMFGYFLPPAWNWLLAIFPTFWPLNLTWDLLAGGQLAWFLLPAGLLYQGVLCAWLLQRVLHRMTP